MKKHRKMILDLVMSILYILCIGYQVTGNKWHEIAGVAMLLLFIGHCILNKYWFGNFKKIFVNAKSAPSRLISLVTDILIIINMILLAGTSVCISRSVFSFININSGYYMSHFHTWLAYVGLILVSVHIGCHLKMILTSICRGLRLNRDSKAVKWLGRGIAFIMVVLGVLASFERGMGKRLLFCEQAGGRELSEGYGNGAGLKDGEDAGRGNGDGAGSRDGEGRGNGENTDLRDERKGPGRGKDRNENPGSNTDEIQTRDNGEGSFVENSSMIQLSADAESGESLEDYLSKLTCTGCGKRCSLLNPHCGRGVEQAQAAAQKYAEANSVETEAPEDTKENIGENTQPENNQNKIVFSGDETLVNLFKDYISISGLYIVGTYYAIEILSKKKKDKSK